MDDLTGAYDAVEPKLVPIVKEKLNSGFVTYDYKGPTPRYNKVIFVPNHFISQELPSNIDISKLIDNNELCLKLAEKLNARIVILGSVQQIYYGQPKEISNYIVDAWLWGVWGLAAREEYERTNKMALVEYNFKIYDSIDESLIKTFNIQGTYSSPIPDRQKLVHEANKYAANGLIFNLNKSITKYFGIKTKEYYKAGNKFHKW